MKKFIFAWAVFLLPAVSVLGQEAVPADMGAVALRQETTPADTQAVPPSPQSPPGDTETVVTPPPESIPADTGAVVFPPLESTPATDTAAAAPSEEKKTPADTAAIPPATVPQPRESAPADTGTVVTPPQESAPVESPAVAPEQEEAASQEPKQPNRVGLGIVFNDEAPLSIRAWFNPNVGLDAGIGLRGRRVDDSTTITDSTPTPTQRVSLVYLSFDLGLPIRVVRKEKVDFIIRPGFGVRTRPAFEVDPTDPSVRSIEIAIELEMNGSVGFEYYPYEKVSFSLQAGLAFILQRTGGDISNSILRLQSLPSQKGVNFAFRYYAF